MTIEHDEYSRTDEVADPADTAEVTRAGDVKPRGKGFWLPRLALAGAVVVAALGLSFWWAAAHDADIAQAEERDAVLIAGTQDIETLNTLDHRDVKGGLKAWSQVTTGLLHDQFAKVGSEQQKLLADQKKISVGKVVDAAVMTLEGSSATVIAAVEISVAEDAAEDKKAIVKRNRFAATMRKVDGEWKLENLQQVAVTTS